MLKPQLILFSFLIAFACNTLELKAQSCIELYGINFENNVVIPVNINPMTAVFDTVTKISNDLNPLSFRRGGLAVAPSDRKLYFIIEFNLNNSLNIRDISFTNNQINDPTVGQELSELQYDCDQSTLHGLLNSTNALQFVSITDGGNISNIGGAINLNPNEIMVEGMSTIDPQENRYFFAVLNTVDLGYTIYVVDFNTNNVNSFSVPYMLIDMEFDSVNGLLMVYTDAFEIVRLNPTDGNQENVVPATPTENLMITVGNTAYDPFEDILYVAGQSTVSGNHLLYAFDATTGTMQGPPLQLAGEVFDLTAGVPCVSIPDFVFENTCQGENTNFTENSVGGVTWEWDFGDPASGADNTSTDPNPSHVFSNSGDFEVTLSIGGCIDVVSITKTISISEAPIFDLGGVITTCETSVILTVPSFQDATYLWISGDGTQSIEATQSIDYYVDVTIGSCTVRDSVEVILGSADTENYAIQGVDQASYCEGDLVTLDATVIGSSVVYDWSTNENTATIDITQSGTYGVTVTQNQCIFMDEVTVDFGSPPIVSIPESGEICGTSATLTVTQIPDATYTWSTNESTPSIEVTSPGTYNVTVNIGACTASATTDIEIIGDIEIDLGANENDEIFACATEPLILNAGIGNPDATFTWSDGVTTDSLFNVPGNGNYTVTVGVGNTCITEKSVEVTFTEDFFVELGADTTICAGETLTLRTGLAGAEHEWSNGETGEEITISEAGTYSVTVRNGACEAEGSIEVGVSDLPNISLTEPRSICPETNDAITLSLENSAGLTFAWSTGENGSQITVNAGGTYEVVATNETGCSSRASVEVVERCESKMIVPSAFSPNGDNANDVFLPESRFVDNYKMEIYNRWGNLVFTTAETSEGWDGLVEFESQPLGVYLYVITYTDVDNLPNTQTGYFTLLR